MSQRSLFEPERLAREELHYAILRLDFNAAERKLLKLQRSWPDAILAWEPELIRAGLKFARRRLDLDAGHHRRQAPILCTRLGRNSGAGVSPVTEE